MKRVPYAMTHMSKDKASAISLKTFARFLEPFKIGIQVPNFDVAANIELKTLFPLIHLSPVSEERLDDGFMVQRCLAQLT